MLDRLFAAAGGALLALLSVSLPICIVMATVVHGATGGMGDGSTRDALALAVVIIAPLVGATVGLVRGDR